MIRVARSGRAARSGSRPADRVAHTPRRARSRRQARKCPQRRGCIQASRLGLRTANAACQRRAKRRFLARLDIQACITERDRPDMREASLSPTIRAPSPGLISSMLSADRPDLCACCCLLIRVKSASDCSMLSLEKCDYELVGRGWRERGIDNASRGRQLLDRGSGGLVNQEVRPHRTPLPDHRDPGRPAHHHGRRPSARRPPPGPRNDHTRQLTCAVAWPDSGPVAASPGAPPALAGGEQPRSTASTWA